MRTNRAVEVLSSKFAAEIKSPKKVDLMKDSSEIGLAKIWNDFCKDTHMDQ